MAKSFFFVDDCGIKYREQQHGGYWDRVIIPKEIFVEAYNKWIKNKTDNYIYNYGDDDADCWCDD